MKKILFSVILAVTAVLNASAYAVNVSASISKKVVFTMDDFMRPLKPTYLTNAVEPSWADNWFIGVSGGTSAFLGSPLGCEDLFGRLKPTLQLTLGKWHTPAVGNRVVFQGFKWKSGELQDQTYNHFHADLLWNLTPTFNIGKADFRWDIIPFAGVGVIDNRTTRNEHFAINYGVQVRYRIKDYLHLNAELGNTTTCANADGIGKSRHLGDNLLSLSAGLTWTFGKRVGWKKVVDARPYMAQNEQLMAYAYAQAKANKKLSRMNDANARLIAELRKILEIEGLLDRYSGRFDDAEEDDFLAKNDFPVNDYSGLNSLRKRLRENEKNRGKGDKSLDTDNDRNGSNKSKLKNDTAAGDSAAMHFNHGASRMQSQACLDSAEAQPMFNIVNPADDDEKNSLYLALLKGGEECLGAPIYFFFELNTATLVNSSQLVNLDEIARVANKYALRIEVVGAADSATGTEKINAGLGTHRASFIADYLQQQGVPTERISTFSVGGIDDYSPNEANRNAAVRLFLP